LRALFSKRCSGVSEPAERATNMRGERKAFGVAELVAGGGRADIARCVRVHARAMSCEGGSTGGQRSGRKSND
jgi:hypothetical protein